MAAPDLFDVGAGDFDALVIEASKQRPVLVDFWAAWCGPCRMLGPVLERIVARHRGAIALARVDSDAEPSLTASHGVRGLPTVKLFKDGTAVAQFVGARTEHDVEAFLAPHLPKPSAGELEAAVALATAGHLAEALERLEHLHAMEPDDAEVSCRLAELQLARGAVEPARALYDALPAPAQVGDDGRRLAARLRFAGELAHAPSPGELIKAAEAGDAKALFVLASYDVMSARFEEAAERLFEILRHHPGWADGRARSALVDLFTILGPQSEAVARYRRRLARLLY